jgi:hypothetical protein
MAPAAIENNTIFSYENPSKKLFPDGIKTSGQFDPEYALLKPYEQFPQEITGPTVWKADEYAKNTERWTHYFSEEELKELSDTSDAFMASETPLTGIGKVSSFLRICLQWI